MNIGNISRRLSPLLLLPIFLLGACDPVDASDAAHVPLGDPNAGPPAGREDGPCDPAVIAKDASSPTTVIGDGTPESCTSASVVAAVAGGGVITFDCGPEPVVISMEETAKIFNDTGPEIVIDGGGTVTLSGMGERRILYMNTCDQAQNWTTPHCDNQDHPRLTVQNLGFVDGNARSVEEGGGAIFVRGGHFQLLNSRFFNNVCDEAGPDVGGGAVRIFDMFDAQPARVEGCTFGGEAGFGNRCANGGALSSIGVSWTISNSIFSHNEATGNGANPVQDGTPGGGSGGAIYNDGGTMTLSICGSLIEENTVNAHGAGIFFVTNNHAGNIILRETIIRSNHGGSWYAQPGISMHDDTRIEIIDSMLSD